MGSIAQELMAFMIAKKKLWMFPVIALLLLLSALAILSHGTVLAPFIYTIF
ncbi:MAG: DUF5989 family protein [Beijerinckiaceae bacterium]